MFSQLVGTNNIQQHIVAFAHNTHTSIRTCTYTYVR